MTASGRVALQFHQLLHQTHLEEKRDALIYQTSSLGLLMSKEYHNRLRILRELNYIDQSNIVNLKVRDWEGCDLISHHRERWPARFTTRSC